MTIPHSFEHFSPNQAKPIGYNRTFFIALTLNFSFMVVEEWVGHHEHSLSLLADGLHNLRDVLGLLLAWTASFLAQRPPTQRYTYGFRRATILTALLNSIILLATIGELVWEAIRDITHPTHSPAAIIIWVAGVGVVVHGIIVLLFISTIQKDLNFRVVLFHIAIDGMSSLGVVLTGIALLTTDWLWFEPVMSLMILVVLLVGGLQLLIASLKLSLDGVPQQIEPAQIQLFLSELPGVVQIQNLHIWPISTIEVALTAHLVMPQGYPGDAFLDQTCKLLYSHFGIGHATLQVKTRA